MYKFLWTGTDRFGTDRCTFVHAENAAAAKESLIAEGWSNLRLLQDEVSASASRATDAPDSFRTEVTADQLAAAFEGKIPSFGSLWLKGISDSTGLVLLSAAMLGFGVFTHRLWSTVAGSIGLAFVIIITPALQLFFGLPLRCYDALNEAKLWGRWDEVLHWVERLRKAGGLTRIGVGKVELARCRAQALAGLGKLDEAVAEFSEATSDGDLPRWVQLSHLAGIFDVAKQFEQSLQLRRQAAEEKPDTASVWIDLAYNLVRGLNRPAEAREALTRAQTYDLPEVAKPYVPFLDGVIAWREQQFAAARQHLEKAITGFEAIPVKNPLIKGVILLTKSYLCAVEGTLGNAQAARALFAETEEFLIGNREEELLTACRRNLGALGC